MWVTEREEAGELIHYPSRERVYIWAIMFWNVVKGGGGGLTKRNISEGNVETVKVAPVFFPEFVPVRDPGCGRKCRNPVVRSECAEMLCTHALGCSGGL